MPPTAHLVFLRDGLVLAKRPDLDWCGLQELYPGFLTSLGPWTEDEIAAYFVHDYTADDARWPVSRAALAAFFASEASKLRVR